MKKIYIVFLLIIVLLLGYTMGSTNDMGDKEIFSIYGIYSSQFDSISFDYDNHYNFSGSIDKGEYKQLDDNMYFITSGDLQNHLVIVQKNEINTIDINSLSKKTYQKVTFTPEVLD